MKFRCSVAPFVVVAVGLVFPQPSLAVGLGGYVSGDLGASEWDIDEFEDDFDPDIDADDTRLGFGIVFDTAPAGDTLFNYRLNFGYHQTEFDFDTTWTERVGGLTVFSATLADINVDGVTIDNSFGFGLLRSDRVRLWAGPRLRLGAYRGDIEFHVFGREYKFDVDVYEAGFGGAFGANVHVGKGLTVAFTATGLYAGFAGDIEDDRIDDGGLAGYGWRFAVNVAFMGRIGGSAR